MINKFYGSLLLILVFSIGCSKQEYSDPIDQAYLSEWSDWIFDTNNTSDITLTARRIRSCQIDIIGERDPTPPNCSGNLEEVNNNFPNPNFIDPVDSASFSEWSDWTYDTNNTTDEIIQAQRTRVCEITINGLQDNISPQCDGATTEIDQNFTNPNYFDPTLIPDGFYIQNNTYVFRYENNIAVQAFKRYDNLASFPLFNDMGYVPGYIPGTNFQQTDDNLIDRRTSVETVEREYYVNGNRNLWVLNKIEEDDIPDWYTHEEIMQRVSGKGFWSDPIYSQIDPTNPVSYVEAFIRDAERHGVDLSHINLSEVTIEFRETGTAGASHLSCVDDERVHLSYRSDFWRSAAYFDVNNERLSVMYHELGHDILNSGHPSENTNAQFMNQGEIGGKGIKWSNDPDISFERMVDDLFSNSDHATIYTCSNSANTPSDILGL